MGQIWDVLVVGWGGCGLVTAVAATERNADVLLLEKQQQFGGNTAYSVGSVPGAGTRYQRNAGIDDSPQRFADDLIRQTNGDYGEERLRHLATFSAEGVIPGLYAGGSTADDISAGGRRYTSGNGLLTAFGWGLPAKHATTALNASS